MARTRNAWMLGGLILILLYVLVNRSLLYSKSIAPYVFVLPFILTFVIFFIYPLVSTTVMSFQSIKSSSSEWIGLKNYNDLFQQQNVLHRGHQLPEVHGDHLRAADTVSVVVRLYAQRQIHEARGMFKAILFVPVLSSVVVAGIIFRMMFSELDGALMNQCGASSGFRPSSGSRANGRPCSPWCCCAAGAGRV
jgi:arabinosaccharide transport system permease protein